MPYPLSSTPFPAGSANPNPAYAGTFIPEIWSSKLIEKFYSSTVLHAISNTDYEGEIKNQGDTVKIRTKPTLTIRDYQIGQPLLVERPSSAIVQLDIDKGKYFSAIVDDIHKLQSDIDLMSVWADDASQQMKVSIDTDVLRALIGGAAASNRGATAGFRSSSVNLGASGTPLAVVARNPSAGQIEVTDILTRLGQVLDERDIPETGRWVVFPAWFGQRIKSSELRDASLTGDGSSILRNGRLGMVDRFTLYTSNLLPTGVAGGLAAGEWAVFAGHAHGLTFASQMTQMETIRSESTFGTILRGMQVFGHRIVDNTALAQAVVVPA